MKNKIIAAMKINSYKIFIFLITILCSCIFSQSIHAQISEEYPFVTQGCHANDDGYPRLRFVIIDENYTYIIISYYAYRNGAIYWTPETRLTIPNTSQSFNVIAWDFVDNKTLKRIERGKINILYNVESNTQYTFMLYFPKIPKGINIINFIEPSWYWYGIHINNPS